MLHNASMPSLTAGADLEELLCGVLAAIGQAPGTYRYLCHRRGLVFFSHQQTGTTLHDYGR